MKNLFLYVLVVLPFMLSAQSRKERKAMEVQQKADEAEMMSISDHYTRLNGIVQQHQQGGNLQNLLSNYIKEQFSSIGLLPVEDNSFIQSFVDEKGQKVDASTFFVIEGDTLVQGIQYFPLVFSANANAQGMPAPDLKEQGEPWFVDVRDLPGNSDADQEALVNSKIVEEVDRATKKGATAVILYNSSNQKDFIAFNKYGSIEKVAIPVVYLQQQTYNKYYADKSAMKEISLSVNIETYETFAKNIVGFIDNGSQSTTIITSGIALPKPGETNAVSENFSNDVSATATLLEIAKMTAASTHKNTNYLFIAFIKNGENKNGSTYWLSNTGLKSNIKYMLNLNHAGGNNTVPGLIVQGYGTSPEWNSIFTTVNPTVLKVSLDPGIDTLGDHAVFYEKGIPSLVVSAIAPVSLPAVNDQQLKNELQVVKFVCSLLETADGMAKLSFTTTSQPTITFPVINETAPIAIAATAQPIKVAEQPPLPAVTTVSEPTVVSQVVAQATPVVTGATPAPATAPTADKAPVPESRPNAPVQYSVSLGVIPVGDYNGVGFKIGGVTPKRLAEKIGLQAGDVLLQLGNHKINEMNSYLQALGNFKKGDVTVLKVLRENDERLFTVEF